MATTLSPNEVQALDEQLWKKQDEASRGIPEAIFIEDVEGLCKKCPPTDVVARLQDLHSKYQYMNSSITAQRAGMRAKLPDIASALEAVEHLVEKKKAAEEEQEYTYQLAENIWAKASATSTDNVCLWLGANCMLEYSLDEAVELLKTNESNATKMLKSLDEDAAFLREQITTTEVNTARCHNYSVKVKQQAKDDAADAQKANPQPKGPPASAKPPAPRSEPGTFTWNQDGDEVEVSIALPEGAQKSGLKVTILADSLKVEHDGSVVIEGQLGGKCSPNGSTWTMGRGRVDVSLEKSEAKEWPSLFEALEV